MNLYVCALNFQEEDGKKNISFLFIEAKSKAEAREKNLELIEQMEEDGEILETQLIQQITNSEVSKNMKLIQAFSNVFADAVISYMHFLHNFKGSQSLVPENVLESLDDEAKSTILAMQKELKDIYKKFKKEL